LKPGIPPNELTSHRPISFLQIESLSFWEVTLKKVPPSDLK
jgi:hypothetical protein